MNYEEKRHQGARRATEGDELPKQGGWIRYRKGAYIVLVQGIGGTSFSEAQQVAHAIESYVKKVVLHGCASSDW